MVSPGIDINKRYLAVRWPEKVASETSVNIPVQVAK
jgi:hypothetical protein